MRRGVGLTCSPQKIIPFNAGGQVHRFLTNVLGESRKTLLQRKFLFQPASSLDHRCTSDRRYRSMDRVCGKLEIALEQSKKRILLGLSLCKNSVAHVTQNETLKLFITDVIEGSESNSNRFASSCAASIKLPPSRCHAAPGVFPGTVP